MSSIITTNTNTNSTQPQTQSFTLALTTTHFPPFTIIPSPTKPTSSSSLLPSLPLGSDNTENRNKRKTMYSLENDIYNDRDRLSIDTFTSVVDRETLYSRASHVATILRSLGPFKENREQGISALCNYIEGKRSKGKTDEEIRKKVSILEGMVPADLGDVFVKASLRSGLARKTAQSLPPIPISIPLKPLRSIHRSRLSLASMSSFGTSNSNQSFSSLPPLPPIPPELPIRASSLNQENLQMQISPIDPPINLPSTPTSASSSSSELISPTFTFSISPTSFSSLDSPDSPIDPTRQNTSTSTSTSRSSATSFSSETSFSSFPSPPPLTSTQTPFSSILPFTPNSPPTPFYHHLHLSSPTSFSATSTTSSSSLGRAPSLLSPLAIGGWGRSWEKPLLNKSSKPKSKLSLDGIPLESFPNPPKHVPSPSSSNEDESDDLKGCNRSCSLSESENDNSPIEFQENSVSNSIMDDNDNINYTEDNVSPTKSKLTERTLDKSWLSISDDNSSSGLPSAGLNSNEDDHYHMKEENLFNLGVGYGFEFGLGMGMGFDDQRTVTGIESSRWSAIVSNRDELSSDEDHDLTNKGPTEASLIRDAYLKMIKPPKLIQIPGPEQGDSHTILMAYAQPTTACSA